MQLRIIKNKSLNNRSGTSYKTITLTCLQNIVDNQHNYANMLIDLIKKMSYERYTTT
jgi:hypothetical protein